MEGIAVSDFDEGKYRKAMRILLKRIAETNAVKALSKILEDLQERVFWLKFDLEVWYAGLPISGWCFKEFIRTGDLGYLHDALRGLLPW